ncbi:translational GTPase TypA [Puniceicoccales bacterium CK1056]|uniref:Large ribosomal subunit assembly factor BipA n=1 Tax=Oceanipulchritudo coccoides TaxID=2706888 RepID=A0A6B2LZK8_9BACT|nr:translational GTPase TypA [Oceanipulchritudo coccoides]NDV61207.1 translational GTPase TypA [Oceanipulchritudo coccoides]
MNPKNIRNIAIIAHVDHGKTTLVDEMLKAGGLFRENQVVADRMMDSMDLEREKGITIKAKNTSVHWKDDLINIVDTPGHADFGAEVERVMKMVDGVLLLVDAHDGPQAQTRFVLMKALKHNLKPIVVINKVDREHANPVAVHDKVLELFLDLEATDEQFNAPFVYASAKNGWADFDLDGPRKDMSALFETIMKHIDPPVVEEGDFRMLVSNIDWNDYVGRVAIGRILSGEVKDGDRMQIIHKDGKRETAKITKLFEYSGMQTSDSHLGVAGNIIGVAGFEELDIGETIVAKSEQEPLTFMEIDPPTIQMEFAVNDGPFAGKDGKKVTSRQIRERLVREMKSNISIQMDEAADGARFMVSARGAMQIAVLVETMRREGFEVLVSRPQVITQEVDGKRCEPFENVWIDVPEDAVGGIMKNLAGRKGKMTGMHAHMGRTTIEANIPTRGLIGFESDLVNMTSGHGVMSHIFDAYKPWAGEIVSRQTGTLVSMEQGAATGYTLMALEERGKLFVAPGDEVYVGMIVGESPKRIDLPVNPTKGKQLTNVRASGSDKNIQLAPPIKHSLERALEYIESDEYVEATPKVLRMRKRILDPNLRKRAEKAGKA